MTAPLELAAFYGLVLLTIWGGQWIGVRPPGGLAVLLVVMFCAASARRHGDGRERLGWDRRHLARSARLTLMGAGPFLLFLLAWAAMPPWPTPERLLFGAKGPPAALQGVPLPLILLLGLFRYPVWALAQEYALLSFCGNRWRDVLGGRPWVVSLANGLAFSLVHAPNPILMTACFAAGTVFTRIFLAAPHILPPALAHGLAGLLLSVIFRNFYPAMMVGPAYLRYAGG